MNVLLIKPYQPCFPIVFAPPLGLLLLASEIRSRLGNDVTVRVIDAKLYRLKAEELDPELQWADVVGCSALNYEMDASFAIFRRARARNPDVITVLGGPLAHRRAVEMLERCPELDWVVDGEADRTFPEALVALHAGCWPENLPGLYTKSRTTGTIHSPDRLDFIMELDELPMPAWDLIDFDTYARNPNMNTWLMGTRYAQVFTSRGCPYKCAYCHDIFTKKFRWRSAENVAREILMLHHRHGVDEFQIVDDIFNLHKPRLREIFRLVAAGKPAGQKLHFCFPNGLRGDILDPQTIDVLADAGAYMITVAIETATPRLQQLIQKNINLDRLMTAIDYAADRGILVKGYFMLGFPTESRRELLNTIRFAWRSRLSFASFFTVTPHPETPLYELARQENAAALERLEEEESYYARKGWYELAYGFPLRLVSVLSLIVFFLHPARALRIIRTMGLRRFRLGAMQLASIILGRNVVPDALSGQTAHVSNHSAHKAAA